MRRRMDSGEDIKACAFRFAGGAEVLVTRLLLLSGCD